MYTFTDYDEQVFNYEEDAIEFLSAISGNSECYLVEIWNDYCRINNYDDDEICMTDEIDDILADHTPSQIIDLVRNGDFNRMDDWFVFTIYGLKSFRDATEWVAEHCDYAFIEWLIHNQDSYDIQGVIEETTE